MIRLNATKRNGYVVIAESDFEYLLNCLDNQKFVTHPDFQSKFEKDNIQKYIDNFSRQCRELLNKKFVTRRKKW